MEQFAAPAPTRPHLNICTMFGGGFGPPLGFDSGLKEPDYGHLVRRVKPGVSGMQASNLQQSQSRSHAMKADAPHMASPPAGTT